MSSEAEKASVNQRGDRPSYPNEDLAPARHMVSTIQCPDGVQVSLTDGDSVVLDGDAPQRRVRLRIVTDTHVATAEICPATLAVSAIPFVTPGAVERMIGELMQQLSAQGLIEDGAEDA